MTRSQPIDRYLTRYPSIAAVTYVALVFMSFLTVIFAVMDIGDRYLARNASAATLARLEHAALPRSGPGSSAVTAPAGSPVLEGQTATVATAALLQHITGAIAHVGGSVVSSEVAASNAQSKGGYVKVSVDCEVEGSALQKLLYEVEAGMPLLFVDHLVAQAPSAASEGGRMHVLLGVSGLWRAAK